MPRISRNDNKTITNTYHIIARGINKQDIFLDNDDKDNFYKMIKLTKEKYNFELYAFALMNNHIHFTIFDKHDEMSKIMHRICTIYAMYFNKKYERVGHVFQNRFKSFPIESEEYLWQCFYYIHLNPVKAKITGKMNRYQYSSAQEYIYEKKGLIRENARQFIKSGQMTYSAERVIPQLEEVYIEDLPEDTKEQKERIFRKWIEIYLEEHPDLQFWDLQKLPENRKDFAETMLDPRVMSRKELLRRLDKFRQ